MAADVRARMIRSAIVQLAKHGPQGASFAEVLAHSGAPRGSVYHHFPGGKQELITAALDYMRTDGLAALTATGPTTPADVVESFVALWRRVLTRTDFSAGCSIVAVTVTADSAELVEQAAAVFRAWHEELSTLLGSAGLRRADARAFATMMIASTEGAVVLARTEHRLDPLDVVHAQLNTLAGTYPRRPR